MSLPAAHPLLERSFSVVDVETTGASAIYDRVVEVAVVRVQGGEIVDRFESLVDPRMPVPPFITRLTGIDDRLVRNKPTFAEIAPRVREALDDGPFVAHNVAFDEAFLRHGFTRAGLVLDLPRLCTLRLARRLLPRLRSYRLDALAAHFGITVGRRHRAGADAETAARVLVRLLDEAVQRGIRDPAQLALLQEGRVTRHRRAVDESVLETLPPGPGVYLLKDQDGHVLYVGKSIHVRQRVREHLRGGSADQPRLRRRLAAIVDVDAIETGSELEALFLESRLIKRYLPEANQLQRNDADYPFIRLDLADPFPRLVATRETPTPETLNFGPFRRRATAAAVVDFLRERFGLRQCDEPLRPGQSACALLDMGKCLGPCVGAVDRAGYRAAAERAAAVLGGRDGALLDELVARRDALAEDLRFEDAARLRDRIRELEHVVGVQRRLEAVAERNLAIVAPSARPGAGELFLIHGGRLAHQLTVVGAVRRAALARALERTFAARPAPVTRATVDEMHLLDGWLRRHTERLAIVQVDPAEPRDALDAIVAALRTARSAPPKLRRPARRPTVRKPASSSTAAPARAS